MRLFEISFSPTGGTKKAAAILSGALAGTVSAVDLTDSRASFDTLSLTPEDTAVIAVPSYGGRVPAPAVKRLSQIHGGGAKAVLVCVYGNRAYEDTLTELRDAAAASGFQVIAAVAAIAEHSVVRRFAAGRPDAQDETILKEFAAKIREKLSSGSLSEPQIPGNRPYKDGGSSMIPEADSGCTACGTCARNCPVQAIDMTDPHRTDPKLCISCMRCISVCPQAARRLSSSAFAAADAMLEKVCSDRKECELYL